jgi:hypothetical protein
VPANHCPENAGDSADAARAYLGGLFPARYAHLTEAFLANAPAMARFVEERSPHRFAACPAYPDYHPERTGASAGGRCLDMELADLSAMAPQARQVRVPPGYLPMTQAGVTTGQDGIMKRAVVDRGGSTERVPAAAVILATGGFDWDEDLRRARRRSTARRIPAR